MTDTGQKSRHVQEVVRSVATVTFYQVDGNGITLPFEVWHLKAAHSTLERCEVPSVGQTRVEDVGVKYTPLYLMDDTLCPYTEI